MFRLANLRNNDLTNVRAVVSLARWVDEGGIRQRRFDQLMLERESIIFMPLHWVIVHPIGRRSPFHGLSQESLGASDPEVVCLITAEDETFAQTVHAKTSYDRNDIVWGARFRDMYLGDVDHVAVDLARLHDLEPVDTPATV
jgi:inward rectifier potassium channel